MSSPHPPKWSPPGKFFVLLSTVILLDLFLPVVRDVRVVFLLSDILLVGVLLAAVYAVSASHRVRLAAAALMGLSLALIYLGRNFSPSLIGAAHASMLIFFVLTATIVLRDVLRDERVSGDKIAGAISFYLLLGITWGVLYSLLAWIEPTSFAPVDHRPGDAPFRGDHLSQFVYFSFVTLSTLGYGDIAPVTRIARSLASLEAVVGQLYLAILVARLVGLQISHSGQQKEAGGRRQEAGRRQTGRSATGVNQAGTDD